MASIFSTNVGRKTVVLLLVLVCAVVFVAPVQAEEAEVKADGDVVGGLLDFGAWFTPFHRTSAFRGLQREIDDQVGIFVSLGGTMTWQIASDVEMGDSNILNATYNLAGEWALLDADFGKGILKADISGGFNLLGADRGESMSTNVGSGLGVNAAAETDELVVGSIYWTQTLFDDQLAIVIGRSSGDTFVDDNRVASDETSQFMADPFTGNPTIAGPGKGGALAASWTIDDKMYFAAGVSDSTAVSSTTGWDTLDDGRWFTSGEFGYATDAGGTYRVNAWYSDIESGNGSGLGISFDQELPGADGLVGFVRAGVADGGLTDIKTFISGGVALEGALGREGDMAGLAVAWGDPVDTTLNDETLIEAFYRYQINQYVEISPDVQWVINPADSTADSVLLFGIRLQITYGGSPGA